jgi:uncharacterized protein
MTSAVSIFHFRTIITLEAGMTPEERQLLTTLAERVKSTPPQQKDPEAERLLQQLVQERPDTVYILAQTVLMQDFALRNAQAQIDGLQRQLREPEPAQEHSSGSFLGGLFGGGGQPPERRPSGGSVPSVNPYQAGPGRGPGPQDYTPPPQGGSYPPYAGGGPVMQPSQTSGFLQNAAATAAGVAGGALLFQGINSLFSGHHGGLGGNLSGITHRDSLSESTVANRAESHGEGVHSGGGSGGSDNLSDADYDPGDDDFGGSDF